MEQKKEPGFHFVSAVIKEWGVTMEDNRKILVIDDDEGIRETYLGILLPKEESDTLSLGRALFDIPSDKPKKGAETGPKNHKNKKECLP